jgi:GNAT superfamily N-acetyltransferase
MSRRPRQLPPPARHLQALPADPADLDTLSQVIAGAFHDLPPSRWLIASPGIRRAIFPRYFRLHAEHAMACGTVHTTADRAAVALWLPLGEDAASQPRGYAARLAAIAGPRTDRFLAFDAALDQHHPASRAHHYLAVLAVRPDRQGEGIGTALLRAYHQILDRDTGAPAYLEAADLRTRRLYLRHGYVPRPDAPFYLPDGGPPMWPMWRESRSQETTLAAEETSWRGKGG